jgi:capsular polysaccharide biosynthesis protein
MRKIQTPVIPRYPSAELTNSTITHKQRETEEIRTPGGNIIIHGDYYWISQNDAFAAPRFRFLLDKKTKSVVVPGIRDNRPAPNISGFGKPITFNADGTQTIEFDIADTVIPGPCLFIPFPGSFGVFLLNTMTGVARANAEISRDVPILVPDDLTAREQGFLSLLNFEDRPHVLSPAEIAVTMEHAMTPSVPYALGFQLPETLGNLKLGAQISAPAVTELNRQSRQHTSETTPLRLFVSRKDASVRHLTNEDEALEALRPWGFQRVIPTEITPRETAQLFANAEIVVGAASSGMLNIVFGPRGSSVIEIDHPVNQRIPQALCRALSMRFRPVGFVPQEARSMVWGDTSTDVDIEQLRAAVAEEIGHQESR